MSKHYNPQRKRYYKNYTPVAELMAMARGRWVEILTAAGIPADALAGRHGRPCPRCGGRDRFSPLIDVAERGAVLCRHCHNGETVPRCGDGIATLRWWLGVDASEALKWLSGWLGVLPGYRSWQVAPSVQPVVNHSMPEVDGRFAVMAEVMRRNLKPGWLARAADMLGLPAEALARLGVGWSPVHGATSWPMRDDAGDVIVIRLRCPRTARKWAVSGSRAGLIYSVDLLSIERPGRVLVCEGPTDTAALLSVGVDAVGVPSAGGGRDLLSALFKRSRPLDVVIVADGDGPGLLGAERTAEALASVAPVRVISPPEGIKDARAWVCGGADGEAVLRACDGAPVRSFVNGRACHE
jgi:phage/plasmid primase-like uncharacterized protein